MIGGRKSELYLDIPMLLTNYIRGGFTVNKNKRKVVSVISKDSRGVIMQVEGDRLMKSVHSSKLILWWKDEAIAIFENKLQYQMLSDKTIYYKIMV